MTTQDDQAKRREQLLKKIDGWVAQAYVNGNLDTHVKSDETQGYETCTTLIMKEVDTYLAAERERVEVKARLDVLNNVAIGIGDYDGQVVLYKGKTQIPLDDAIAELERRKEKTS